MAKVKTQQYKSERFFRECYCMVCCTGIMEFVTIKDDETGCYYNLGISENGVYLRKQKNSFEREFSCCLNCESSCESSRYYKYCAVSKRLLESAYESLLKQFKINLATFVQRTATRCHNEGLNEQRLLVTWEFSNVRNFYINALQLPVDIPKLPKREVERLLNFGKQAGLNMFIRAMAEQLQSIFPQDKFVINMGHLQTFMDYVTRQENLNKDSLSIPKLRVLACYGCRRRDNLFSRSSIAVQFGRYYTFLCDSRLTARYSDSFDEPVSSDSVRSFILRNGC